VFTSFCIRLNRFG